MRKDIFIDNYLALQFESIIREYVNKHKNTEYESYIYDIIESSYNDAIKTIKK